MSQKDNSIKSQKDNSITEKMQKLENLTAWFSGEDFNIDEALVRYKEAQSLAKEIEDDLKNLRNEITILAEDFTKS